jgi:hypothetical protein
MHLSPLLPAILFTALTTAQNLTGLPPCGLECRNANLCHTACDPADTPCLCKDQTFFLDVYNCEAATCPGNDAAGMFVFSYNYGEWDGRCGGMNGRWMRNKEIDRGSRNEDWLKEEG